MHHRVKVEGTDEVSADGARVIRARVKHGPQGGARRDSCHALVYFWSDVILTANCTRTRGIRDIRA